MIPSATTLTFITDTRGAALALRRLLDGRADPLTVSEAAARWDRQCYHRPGRVALTMEAANELLGGYGVEAVESADGGVLFTYVNMGDTYTLTLVRHAGRYLVASWGDLVERLERRGVMAR
jgi:hypothetical protein